MIAFNNQDVEKVFMAYPESVRERMLELRDLVYSIAKEKEIGKIEETLKWGEPSYIAKNGSTLRMDWKERNPNQYALYFSCSTSLVETFRIVFKENLRYEGKRAVVFDLNAPLPKTLIAVCIEKALTYKLVKDLPLLGIANN